MRPSVPQQGSTLCHRDDLYKRIIENLVHEEDSAYKLNCDYVSLEYVFCRYGQRENATGNAYDGLANDGNADDGWQPRSQKDERTAHVGDSVACSPLFVFRGMPMMGMPMMNMQQMMGMSQGKEACHVDQRYDFRQRTVSMEAKCKVELLLQRCNLGILFLVKSLRESGCAGAPLHQARERGSDADIVGTCANEFVLKLPRYFGDPNC